MPAPVDAGGGDTGRVWQFRYSYWSSSQSYMMTRGWSRFVHGKRLAAGDTIPITCMAQLAKAYQTAGVLFKVLCAVNKNEKVEQVNPEIIRLHRDLQEKKDIYVPFNILPLDAASASQSIMQLEERDSVRNQREHLILLLANVHIRLEPKPDPLSKACSSIDIYFDSLLYGYQCDKHKNVRRSIYKKCAGNLSPEQVI